DSGSQPCGSFFDGFLTARRGGALRLAGLSTAAARMGFAPTIGFVASSCSGVSGIGSSAEWPGAAIVFDTGVATIAAGGGIRDSRAAIHVANEPTTMPMATAIQARPLRLGATSGTAGSEYISGG